MTDDLVTWLRAQLDEDERLANLAGGLAGFRWVETDDDPETPGRVEDEQGRVIIWDHEARLSGHIGRHSPARVLVEVGAKRRILDAFEQREAAAQQHPNVSPYEQLATGLYLAIRLLATAYADRPGYDEAWRP